MESFAGASLAAEEQVSLAGTSSEAPLLHVFGFAPVLGWGFGCEDDPPCSFLCRMKQSDACRDLPACLQTGSCGGEAAQPRRIKSRRKR